MLYGKFITGCLATALLLGSCTKETEQKGTDPVTPDTGNSRREVMLTLKNKLAIDPVASKAGNTTAATKAEKTIATAAENTISTIDVYVFGATEENGNYTFLERFAYRAEADQQLPRGANELLLNTTEADGNETTGLLKIKKGLFVKLYCIANDTELVDPLTKEIVKPEDFTPITFTENEDGTPRLATEGIPHESTFTTYHTHLLSATVTADTLATPLAMAGALTTPLDLTDSGSAARVQAGIRLTRLVARYDINNEAGNSRFTIETVSMGNARRGSGYFPIRPYGDMPEAKPDELFTSPVRRFYGEKANNGLQTGAFYSYPAPQKDNAFLILKGMYKVNETEYKEVSYQVPFTRLNENGTATMLEIANNHRYTLAITAADLYHLDCNISVDDWADDGSIIEFNPNDDNGELVVTIPDDFKDDTQYDPETRSVSMSLKPESKFELNTTASSSLTVEKKYAGGLAAQQYDWLDVSEPVISTKTALNFAYTFSLKEGYTGGRYPRAVLRFTNTMNGDETTLFVDAVSVPQADNTPQPGTNNPNSFDAENLLVNLYRTTASNAHVRITCPDGAEVDSKPDWLDVTIYKQTGAETIYSFTLNNRDIADVPEDKGIVTFRNNKVNDLKTDITVQLLDASLQPDFNTSTIENGGKNSFEAATDDKPANINMQISDANKFAISCKSMQGIEIGMDFDGGPEWLKVAGVAVTKALNENNELTFSLDNAKLGGAKKATITLKNKVGGKNTVFTVSPVFLAPTVAFVSGSSSPTQNSFNNSTVKLYRVSGSKINLKASSLGGTYVKSKTGVNISDSQGDLNQDKIYTVTWDGSATSGSVVFANKTDIRRETTIDLNLPSPDITATNNISVTAANSGNTNISVTSPEGVTATVLDNNWNNGGQWFDITTNTTGSGTQNIIIAQLANNASTVMKPVTIRLTNKINGAPNKDITITPGNFVKPIIPSSQGTISQVRAKNNVIIPRTLTITPSNTPMGGLTATSSNPGIATASVNSTSVSVAAKGIGTATITISNASATNLKATYTVTVQDTEATLYNGTQVWYYYGYMIAPTNARVGPWETDLTSAYCKDKTGADWHVPHHNEWADIIGQNAGVPAAEVAQEYTSKGVFGVTKYWAQDTYSRTSAWGVFLASSSSIYLFHNYGKSYNYSVRCIAKP